MSKLVAIATSWFGTAGDGDTTEEESAEEDEYGNGVGALRRSAVNARHCAIAARRRARPCHRGSTLQAVRSADMSSARRAIDNDGGSDEDNDEDAGGGANADDADDDDDEDGADSGAAEDDDGGSETAEDGKGNGAASAAVALGVALELTLEVALNRKGAAFAGVDMLLSGRALGVEGESMRRSPAPESASADTDADTGAEEAEAELGAAFDASAEAVEELESVGAAVATAGA